MGTVDLAEANRVAKAKADRSVALMYPEGRTNTTEARQAWSRIFWREYRARASPIR
jgi:hypothetical protein